MVDNAIEICEEYGYKKNPVYCDERLDQALTDLENAWIQTNKNIELEIDDKGSVTWKLTYDTDEAEKFTCFDDLPKRDIAEKILCTLKI